MISMALTSFLWLQILSHSIIVRKNVDWNAMTYPMKNDQELLDEYYQLDENSKTFIFLQASVHKDIVHICQ